MQIPVYIGKSKRIKNIRAVIAARSIQQHEIIESCPVILIPKNEWDDVDKTTLGHYNYAWDGANDCIVLGYCGLVNHSYKPNARYKKQKNTMVYIAIADITKDEEITVNYNGDPKNTDLLDPDYLDAKR